MDLIERAVYLAIGGVLGFILGYIVARLSEIKEELDEVDHIVKYELKHQRNEEGAFRFPQGRQVVLLLVVLLVAYSAFLSQKASNDIKKQAKEDIAKVEAQTKTALVERCKSGVDTRTVQRDTVEAVFNLATATLPERTGGAKLSESQKQQYNAYIDRVNDFRDDMYTKIRPSEQCAPYVEDDNVLPPPPPYPRFQD